MSREPRDLAGMTFGSLTALERTDERLGRGYVVWLCRCSCGQEVAVSSDRLRSGSRKACGINGHFWRKRPDPSSPSNRPEHRHWRKMIDRCTNPNAVQYPRYGGAGISVSPKWLGPDGFQNFLADLGPRPSARHTLDRHPDCRGDYEPGNVRWATSKEQARNTTRSVYVEHEGKRVLLVDLVDRLGLTRETIYGRLRIGWPLDEALTEPVRKYRRRQARKGEGEAS